MSNRAAPLPASDPADRLVVRLGVAVARSAEEEAAAERWAAENADWIAAYDADIERRGVFGDQFRTW